jgi:hypothetical protein
MRSVNQDTGSAIITLASGKQVHASITIEETDRGWSMTVTGTPTAGAVCCETLWARHGSDRRDDS